MVLGYGSFLALVLMMGPFGVEPFKLIDMFLRVQTPNVLVQMKGPKSIMARETRLNMLVNNVFGGSKVVRKGSKLRQMTIKTV